MNNINILGIQTNENNIHAFITFGDDETIHSFIIFTDCSATTYDNIELYIYRKWDDSQFDHGGKYEYEYSRQCFHIQQTKIRLNKQIEALEELKMNRTGYEDEN